MAHQLQLVGLYLCVVWDRQLLQARAGQTAAVYLQAHHTGRHVDDVDVIDLWLRHPLVFIEMPRAHVALDDLVAGPLDGARVLVEHRHGQKRHVIVVTVEGDDLHVLVRHQIEYRLWVKGAVVIIEDLETLGLTLLCHKQSKEVVSVDLDIEEQSHDVSFYSFGVWIERTMP